MFKFRLQSVLKYRQFLEDMKKSELASAQAEYQKQVEREHYLTGLRLKYRETLREESQRQDIDINKLTFIQSYILELEYQIALQKRRVQQAYEAVVKKQEELVEARRAKEVMVKAREKAFRKYQQEENLREQKILDDVASVRYVRSAKHLDSTAAKV